MPDCANDCFEGAACLFGWHIIGLENGREGERLLLLLVALEDESEGDRDRESHVKSISTPLGVGTNYCLISGAEAALLAASLSYRAQRIKTLWCVCACVKRSNEKKETESMC